jgi:hypothetical protein
MPDADFSNTTISMTDEQGINIPLTIEPEVPGSPIVGDNTIVWVPDQAYLNLNSSEDEKYTINISSFSIVLPIANQPPIIVPPYSYEVIIMTEMNGSNLVHPPNCPNMTVWDEDSCSCINQSTSSFTIPTPSTRKLDKVVDALGREVNHTNNQILFHIYDDGSVEKKFFVE